MKKICLAFLMLLGVSLYGGETPTTPPKGVKIVTNSDVESFGNNAVIYDVRKGINFGKGHVPGAKSLPVKWVSKKVPHIDRDLKFKTKKLNGDHSKIYVVYSDGIEGWKSYHFSRILAEKGYKNVNWLRTGYNGWKAAH